MTIFLGTVLGGPEFESRERSEAEIAAFAKFGITLPKSETGNEPKVGDEFGKIMRIFESICTEDDQVGSLNPVFFFHGTQSKITFTKPRTGKFSKAERKLMIQIPVPKSKTFPDKIGPFVFDQLREVLPMAQMVFKKAKIPFDVESAHILTDRAEKIYNKGEQAV